MRTVGMGALPDNEEDKKLLKEIADLKAENTALKQEIMDLKAENAALKQEIADLKVDKSSRKTRQRQQLSEDPVTE